MPKRCIVLASSYGSSFQGDVVEVEDAELARVRHDIARSGGAGDGAKVEGALIPCDDAAALRARLAATEKLLADPVFSVHSVEGAHREVAALRAALAALDPPGPSPEERIAQLERENADLRAALEELVAPPSAPPAPPAEEPSDVEPSIS